jgi:hypothetical protein
MTDPSNPSMIETKVEAAFHSIAPDPAFAARLRGEILAWSAVASGAPAANRPEAVQPTGLRGKAHWRRGFNLPGGRPVRISRRVAIALLILAITLAGLALVRLVLGFVPGFGFVNETTAVHLCEPVQMTYNHITLKINSAGGDSREGGKRVVLVDGSVEGAGNRVYSFHMVDDQNREVKLLPGGGGGGGFDFEGFTQPVELPGNRMTWTVRMAPDDPSLPEEETLKAIIKLCPGSQPGPAGTTTPGAYVPVDNLKTVHGITIQLMQVYQSDQTTGLQARILKDLQDADNLGAQGNFTPWINIMRFDANAQNVTLVDDAGNSYMVTSPQAESTASAAGQKTFESQVIQPAAHKLTLQIQTVVLDYPGAGNFHFDPGPNPQYNQTWDLSDQPGAHLAMGSFDVSILSARYFVGKIEMPSPSMGQMSGAFLTFDARIQGPSDRITNACPEISLPGTRTGCIHQNGDRYLFFVDLTTKPLAGAVDLALGTIQAIVAGPWEISWDIPQEFAGKTVPQPTPAPPEEAQITLPAPGSYTPAGASATVSGVTIQAVQALNNVDHTLVQIKVAKDPAAPENQGPQSAYQPVLVFYFYDQPPEAYFNLSDSNGVAYAARSSGTEPDENGLNTLEFDPLQPGAQKLNLRVEKVIARFDEKPIFQFDPGANPQPGQTWDLSDRPDMQFKINGCNVQLKKARYFVGETVIDQQGTTMPGIFLEFSAEARSEGNRFTDLKPSLIVNGQTYATTVPDSDGSFRLIYQLDDALSGPLVGELHLEATLRGPWNLEWEKEN